MDDAEQCDKCGAVAIVLDSVLGSRICERRDTHTLMSPIIEQACGWVASEGELRAQLQSFAEGGQPTGVYVPHDEAQLAAVFSGGKQTGQPFPEKRPLKFHARRRVKEFAARIRLSRAVGDQAFCFLEQVLEGKWGTGHWLDILSGACLHLAALQSNVPVTLHEIGGAVQSSVYIVARAYTRLVAHLNIPKPGINPEAYLVRAAGVVQGINSREHDRLLLRARLLLALAKRSDLFAGRRPLPLVAALLVLSAKSLQLTQVDDETVCQALYVSKHTVHQRVHELQDILFSEARKLPWGGSINARNIGQHLPLLLDCMEALEELPVVDAITVAELPAGDLQPHKASQHIVNYGTRKRKSRRAWHEAGPGVDVVKANAAATAAAAHQQWPPSFKSSEQQRVRLRMKIQETKLRLEQQQACERDQASLVDGGGDQSAAIVPYTRVHSMVDAEDTAIEQLLRQGVPEANIESTRNVVKLAAMWQAAGDVALREDTEILDKELAAYIRSDAEVRIVQQMEDVAEKDT
eukprot:jgi/Chlat1/2185/Chrsp17S02855